MFQVHPYAVLVSGGSKMDTPQGTAEPLRVVHLGKDI